MKRGQHEPWGDEPRRTQLWRVLLGFGVVLVVAGVVALFVVL